MMDFSKAAAELQKGKLSPVYTLLGTEFILAEEWIYALSRRLSEQTGETVTPARYTFDEGGLESALLACQSLSLFQSTQLVVLNHVWPAGAGKAPSKAKGDVEELESYLENPLPTNVLVIVVPTEKFDERKKLTKRLKQYPIIDCTVPKDAPARQLLLELASRWRVDIDKPAVEELWRRALSVSRAASEMKKLWTYTDGIQIRELHVRELVAPPADDNIFTWIDGVVTGDVERAFSALEDIVRAGYDAFALFGMIVRQLRLMWYAKALGGRGYSAQQIAAEAGAHPYAVQVAMRQSSHVSTTDLEELLTVVADMEYAVKSGRRDGTQALEYVLSNCVMKLRRSKVRFGRS